MLCSNEIVAFATIDRNEDLLAEDPPIILLQVLGDVTKILEVIVVTTARLR